MQVAAICQSAHPDVTWQLTNLQVLGNVHGELFRLLEVCLCQTVRRVEQEAQVYLTTWAELGRNQ